MAHIWTLAATETITGIVNADTKLCSDDTYQNVYFDNGAGGNIYQWDGATLTDLAFRTWMDANYSSGNYRDLTWFNGNLYAAFNGDGGAGVSATIAKYSGGAWSEVANLNGPTFRFLITTLASRRLEYLASDANRIVAAVSTGYTGGELYESTDGTTWSKVQISAADVNGFPYVLGNFKNIRRNVLTVDGRGSTPWVDWRVIDASSGWAHLSAGDIGSRPLQGFLDGKSFFAVKDTSDSDWKLAYSTDWGVNVAFAGGPVSAGPPTAGAATCEMYKIFDIDDTAQFMIWSTENKYWEWNTGTNQWNDQGAVDSADIAYGFFKLNNELFALCENGSGSVRFYSGGALTPAAGNARFYQGLNTLTERFTLPFGSVAPRGMTLDQSLGTVVIGADAPAGEPVIYSQHPYPTGTVSAAGFPTGTAITALKWV